MKVTKSTLNMWFGYCFFWSVIVLVIRSFRGTDVPLLFIIIFCITVTYCVMYPFLYFVGTKK